MRIINFKASLARKILEGYKKSTIRKEKFEVGEKVLIKSGNLVIGEAIITNVKRIRLKEIDRETILKEGFYSREALIKFLRKIYPEISEEDFVYLVEFKLIPSSKQYT